jgi:hypothetical protein
VININALSREEVLAVSCDTCGAGGGAACMELMSLINGGIGQPRIDAHSTRKVKAALYVKMIRENEAAEAEAREPEAEVKRARKGR